MCCSKFKFLKKIFFYAHTSVRFLEEIIEDDWTGSLKNLTLGLEIAQIQNLGNLILNRSYLILSDPENVFHFYYKTLIFNHSQHLGVKVNQYARVK